jgi:hypothetical protein
MPDSILNLKRYIGDGAYANFDGYSVILTTENGVEEYNKIFLEPNVLLQLEDYVKELRDRKILPPR